MTCNMTRETIGWMDVTRLWKAKQTVALATYESPSFFYRFRLLAICLWKAKQSLAFATHESPSIFLQIQTWQEKAWGWIKIPQTYRGTHNTWFGVEFYSCSRGKWKVSRGDVDRGGSVHPANSLDRKSVV